MPMLEPGEQFSSVSGHSFRGVLGDGGLTAGRGGLAKFSAVLPARFKCEGSDDAEMQHLPAALEEAAGLQDEVALPHVPRRHPDGSDCARRYSIRAAAVQPGTRAARAVLHGDSGGGREVV